MNKKTSHGVQTEAPSEARACGPKASRAPRQAGYALLMVVFLVAMMVIASAAAVPNLFTQGQREKEAELIWRGEQYARAVKLFYRKNGRFPTSVDDLAKGTNNIHFLRKTYKEPMNKKDGSWRLIYVSPNGQLIGSVTRLSALQLPGVQQPGGRPATPSGPSGKAPDQLAAPTSPTGTASGTTSTSGTSSGTEDSGRVFGGNIIGVASKVDKHSIRVYNDRENYREWEFIWDPAKDIMGAPGLPGTPQRPGQGPLRPPGAPPARLP